MTVAAGKLSSTCVRAFFFNRYLIIIDAGRRQSYARVYVRSKPSRSPFPAAANRHAIRQRWVHGFFDKCPVIKNRIKLPVRNITYVYYIDGFSHVCVCVFQEIASNLLYKCTLIILYKILLKYITEHRSILK